MSKYKAGDKFIIEIEDVLHIESDKGLWLEPWYLVNGMEGICFEDDNFDSLKRYDGDKGVWNAGYKTGYDKGYQEGALNPSSIGYEHGYEAGLNDAWECARELVHSRAPEEWDIMCDLFSVERGRQCDIIAKTTASEAIEKLRDYEAKKAEIKVGDEVIDGNEILFVVTEVHMDTVTVMNCVGHSYQLWRCGLKKTGRHFPIEDILEQMRGE